MDIIIPLGGKGERFTNEGFKAPKPLIKVFNLEMIRYVLNYIMIMPSFDPERDTISIIYAAILDDEHAFSSFIKEWYPSVNLIQIHEYTRGAAETLLLGLAGDREKPCIIFDCDTFYTCDILGAAKQVESSAVFYFEEPPTEGKALFSYIALDEKDGITDIVEKQRISTHANTGVYLFSNAAVLVKYCQHVIANNQHALNEFYTSCVIGAMLKDRIPFKGIRVEKEHVISLGTPRQVRDFCDRTYGFLFDLDGTLVDTNLAYVRVWSHLLAPYNVHVTLDLFLEYIQGKNDHAALKTLVPSLQLEDIQQISRQKDQLFADYIHTVRAIPGAVSALYQIKQAGHKLCIVTNCNRDTAVQILENLHIRHIVDHLIIGNECVRSKPHPDPYLVAMDKLDMPRSKVLIFEDSPTGLKSAIDSKPKMVIGISGNWSGKELCDLGADLVVEDYKGFDLQNLLSLTLSESKQIKNKEQELVQMVTSSLQKSGLAVKKVHIDETKLKGGFIADILSLSIETDLGCLPCVLKLQGNGESSLGQMAYNLDLYGREYTFYESLYPCVNVSVPKCYGIVKDADFRSRGILLESLIRDNMKLNLDLNKEPVNVSLKVIERLAQMHGQFWNKCDAFPMLLKNSDALFRPAWSNFVSNRWGEFKAKWTHLLTPRQLELGDAIVAKFDAIQDHLSQGPLTLCHGDVKSANIFYECNGESVEPHFIDWQYIVAGKGVQDLAFFMIESFDSHVLKDMTSLFKEYYYRILRESGVSDYSKASFEKDFALACCYFPFFVAIWFGTTKKEDLVDLNFPFFFIQKLFSFLSDNVLLADL